ncbi:unnamed protein product [Amoebophrya sp. A120]|nr:unnamed protein product [Amoebophrya sp. A120]|eukprot:GSA120T00001342001.1
MQDADVIAVPAPNQRIVPPICYFYKIAKCRNPNCQYLHPIGMEGRALAGNQQRRERAIAEMKLRRKRELQKKIAVVGAASCMFMVLIWSGLGLGHLVQPLSPLGAVVFYASFAQQCAIAAVILWPEFFGLRRALRAWLATVVVPIRWRSCMAMLIRGPLLI